MAYYDFDPSLDFEAQEQEMLQAAARIKALRGMKAPDIEQPEGFKSAVTGAGILAPTVRKRALGQLVPVIADYTAGQQEKELNTQRARMSQAQQDALASWIKGTPQPTEEALGPTEPTGAFTGDQASILSAIQGIADPNERAAALQGYRNQLQGNKRTVAPTRQAVLEHAQAGMRNPLSRTLAAQYLSDQLVKEPEREEARAARLHEKQTAAEATRAKQLADQEFRRTEAEKDRLARAENAALMANVRRDVSANKTGPTGSWQKTGVDPETGQDIWENLTTGGRQLRTGADKALPAAVQKKIDDASGHAIEIQDLRSRYDPAVMTGLDVSALANPEGWAGSMVGSIGKSGLAGPEKEKAAIFWSDANRMMLNERRILSGQTVTEGEKKSYGSTAIGPMSSETTVMAWMDRAEALANLHAARSQALASPQNKLDHEKGAVVNKRTGEVIPGTESPFAQATPGPKTLTREPGVRPAAAAPAAQPAYDPRAAFLAAQEAYMKDPSKANEQAVRNAESDVLRSQSTSEAPAPAAPPVRRRKWNPSTGKLE